MKEIGQPANTNRFVARGRAVLNMVIVEKPIADSNLKDFEAEPRASVLLLRRDVTDALYTVGARTLTDLLSLSEERSTLLLSYMPGWNADDLTAAMSKLKNDLRGIVADHILDFGIDSMRVALAVRNNEAGMYSEFAAIKSSN